MANKLWALACIGHESYGRLSPRPHYPSMPKYPKGVSGEESSAELGLEAKALFSVTGMTCSACAGSVEKAIKRLPGIREAAVDVLNNKAHVLFYPSFVNVSCSLNHFWVLFDFVVFCLFMKKNVFFLGKKFYFLSLYMGV
jgi:Cu+-exporting ATPase